MGQVCILCGNSKSPSNIALPIIHVGEHRQLKLCKKTHIRKDGGELVRIIECEIAYIKERGDQVVDTNREMWIGSDEEESTAGGEEEVKFCAGFSNLRNESRCVNIITEPKIWIKSCRQGSGEKRDHFCKGTHLTRYLLKYCLSQGRKSAEGTAKKKVGAAETPAEEG